VVHASAGGSVTNFGFRSESTSPARKRMEAAGLRHTSALLDAKYREHEIIAAQQLAAMKAAVAAERRKRLMARLELAFAITRRHRQTDVLSIVEDICEKYKIPERDIFSHRSHKTLMVPRHECWWRVRNETRLSYPVIAAFFHRDHTTIMDGCRRHEERMEAGEA
jgi:chromosomal replication initiation ATPase DnaA